MGLNWAEETGQAKSSPDKSEGEEAISAMFSFWGQRTVVPRSQIGGLVHQGHKSTLDIMQLPEPVSAGSSMDKAIHSIMVPIF